MAPLRISWRSFPGSAATPGRTPGAWDAGRRAPRAPAPARQHEPRLLPRRERQVDARRGRGEARRRRREADLRAADGVVEPAVREDDVVRTELRREVDPARLPLHAAHL